MGPPSSGGIAVAQALGILENFDLGLFAPTAIDIEGGKPSVFGVHLVSEAERLAYADRDKYVADTDFVPLPGGTWDTMLNKPYLRSRAGADQLRPEHGHGASRATSARCRSASTHGRERHDAHDDRRQGRQRGGR